MSATRFNVAKDDLFNLTIYEDPGKGRVEKFSNVTVKSDAGPRRLDRVLADESNLVRVLLKNDGTPDLPAAKPGESKAEEDPANSKADPAKFKKLSSGSDGSALTKAADFSGDENSKTGMFALEKADIFNLLCVPPDARDDSAPDDLWQTLMKYCARRRAMLIVDSPKAWSVDKETAAAKAQSGLSSLNLTGQEARNAAIFFPRVLQTDPKQDGQLNTFVPCGVVAGIMARTDATRGVWKAPAGLDATSVFRLWKSISMTAKTAH